MPSAYAPNTDARAWAQPSTVLAWTLFLVPAVGVPSELMLQDTLKSAVAAFGVLGAALLFFWQQRQRSTPLQWHGLVWLPLVLMGYALGSMAWSHTYLAGVEAIRWFLFALLLWLGLNTLTPHNLPRLLWGIHAGAVTAALWAALQFWLDFGLFPQGAAPASTFINRNFFAEYLVCTVPFSVYLLAQLRSSRWRPLVAGSLALNLVALMMTGTRSALVALWVMVPVLLLILVKYRQQFAFVQWSKASRAAVVLVLVAGVLGLGALLPSGNPRVVAEGHGTTALQRSFARTSSMAQPTEYTEGSFSVRSLMWKATARMVMAHPWTGVGAGAWEVQIPLYQRAGEGLETDYYAHNEFLQLLGEYGAVVGGLFLAVLFAYLLLAAGTTWRLQGTDLKEAPLRSLVLVSLLALLMVSNAGFPWHLAGAGALFALNLGLLAASDSQLQLRDGLGQKNVPWRPVHSLIALTFLLCTVVLTTRITYLAGQAEYKIVRAIQLTYLEQGTTHTSEAGLATRRAVVLQNLREGIAINPHYRKITAIAADRLLAGGNRADALWILESIVASRPFVPDVWANIVLINLELGHIEQARAAYLHLSALQPDLPRTRALESMLSHNRD